MNFASQTDHSINITPILIHLPTMRLVKFGEIRLLRPGKASFDTIISFWCLLLRLCFRLLSDLTAICAGLTANGLLTHYLLLRLIRLFCLSHIFF